MNSIGSDIKRAVFSFPFLFAVLLQYILLKNNQSELYNMSIPLVCTFPYSTAWLAEHKSGFEKLALHRTSEIWYITAKYSACIISGGLCELLPYLLFIYQSKGELSENYALIFYVGALWSGTAAMLSAATMSKCCAYGGPFVICYFLVILHERYWKSCYYIEPFEWVNPQNIWFFGETGLRAMLISIIALIGLIYAAILERRIRNA